MNNTHTKQILLLVLITTLFSYSLLKIKIGDSNNSKFTTFTIKFEYFGIDPVKLEKIITIPLEEKISELEAIHEIKSSIQFNESITTVSFLRTSDTSSIYQNLSQITEDLYNTLPQNVQKPQIIGADIQNKAAICISIDANKTYIEKNIKPLFESIEGVTEVILTGGKDQIIESSYSSQKLAFHQLNPFHISETISNSNCDSLFITNIEKDFKQNFYFNNKPFSLSQIEQTFINEKNIPLKNITTLSINSQTGNQIVLLNDKETIFLNIKTNSDANLISISYKCQKIINSKQFKTISPIIIYDKGNIQKKHLISTAKNLLLTIIISSVLIYIFFRNKTLLFVSIIEIILTTIWTLATFPFYNNYIIPILQFVNSSKTFPLLILNTNSLSGLTLSIGLITDVLLVAYELFINSKNPLNFKNQFHLFYKSAITSTLTTILAVIPLLFMNTFTYGISETAFTIILMLIYSTIISLLFLPSFFTKNEINKDEKLSRIYIKHFSFIYNYKNHIKIFFLLLTICASSLFIISKKNIEVSDTSNIIYSQIFFNPEKTKESVQTESQPLIDYIQNLPEVDFIKSEYSRGHAELEIVYSKTSAHKLTQKLKNKTILIPEAFIYFSETSSNKKEKPIALQFIVTGDSESECRNIASKAASLISENKLALQTVLNFSKEEKLYTLIPNQSKLSKLNIYISQFSELLRTNIFSPVVSKYFINSKETDIKLKNEIQINTQNLADLQLINSIPLKSLGTISESTIPSIIYRNNCRPCAYFTIEINKNNLSKTIKKIENQLTKLNLSENYFINLPTQFLETKNIYKLLTLSIIICLICIYLFLVALNENFYLSLIILLTIPVSLFLPLLIRFISNTSLNFGDCIGIILLSGIVINNSIYISESKGKTPLQKTKTCFESILITSLTTILSSLPMMIFSTNQFIQSLSFFMFFGTCGSIISSLYLFPFLLKTQFNLK